MSDELLADRYKLIRRIGEGGYGTVWLARDEQLRREVAIKKLSVRDRSRKASQQHSDRFRHEAITMAKIDHANVVTIYDVKELEDTQELFLVMELLEGRSLLEEIAIGGPMDRQRVLDRFIETLDGLQAAHDVGVVHKDLKPANLYLHRVDTPREQMKLIDFGIARMSSLTKLTGTGRMAGSPRYLAPEYIMGESVTPAIDIYQTALILVEALTGSACIPRGLEYFAICERHILSQLDVPEELQASPLGPALDRALQRRPGDRFLSAEAFADELRMIRPEELPVFDVAKTVRMEVPNFDERDDMPSSEATVSGMVDKLRQEEAALRPAGQTRRYAGVQQADLDETEIMQSGPLLAAPDAEPEPEPERVVSTASGPQPVPVGAPKQSRGELRLMALGAFLLAVTILGATLFLRTVEGDPIVKNELPASRDTCLLRCTQWYQEREVRGECQALCDSIRPPTAPPFPLIDAVEPQFSEEIEYEEEPAEADDEAPTAAEAPADPEPSEDAPQKAVEAIPTEDPKPETRARFKPVPQKFDTKKKKRPTSGDPARPTKFEPIAPD